MIRKFLLFGCIVGCQEKLQDVEPGDKSISIGNSESTPTQHDEKHENTPLEKKSSGHDPSPKEEAEAIVSKLSAQATEQHEWLKEIIANFESSEEGRDARGQILERKLHELPNRLDVIIAAESSLRGLTFTKRLNDAQNDTIESIGLEILLKAIDAAIAKQESLSYELSTARQARENSTAVLIALYMHAVTKANSDYGELVKGVLDAAEKNAISADSMSAMQVLLRQCQESYGQSELGGFNAILQEQKRLVLQQVESLRRNSSRNEANLLKELAEIQMKLQGFRLARAMAEADKREKSAFDEAQQWPALSQELLTERRISTQNAEKVRAEYAETLRVLAGIHDTGTKADKLFDDICLYLRQQPPNFQEEVEVLVLELDSLPNHTKTLEKIQQENLKRFRELVR